MKRLAAVVVAMLGVLASPAAADDDDGGSRNQRNKNGRDCKGSQDCSTLSPSFEDSPVDRSFNPTICLPFARCGGDGNGDRQAGEADN